MFSHCVPRVDPITHCGATEAFIFVFMCLSHCYQPVCLSLSLTHSYLEKSIQIYPTARYAVCVFKTQLTRFSVPKGELIYCQQRPDYSHAYYSTEFKCTGNIFLWLISILCFPHLNAMLVHCHVANTVDNFVQTLQQWLFPLKSVHFSSFYSIQPNKCNWNCL